MESKNLVNIDTIIVEEESSLKNKCIQNIDDDRNLAHHLINELMLEIKSKKTHHFEAGNTLAKYVEVLQRSNEQLVKLASVEKKKVVSENLSKADIDSIYDDIQQSVPKKK